LEKRLELRSSPSIDEQFKLARVALTHAQKMINGEIRTIRINCGADPITAAGKLSEKKLEQYQQACYDMAVQSANIWAARSYLDYAEGSQDDTIGQALALSFVAEKTRDVLAQSIAGGGNLTAGKKAADSILADEALHSYLEFNGGNLHYDLVGRDLAELSVQRLPSGLSEEKELIANTFKRFADEVVAPLAESIHREDLDIPEQIIGPAAEMGCFGTCIPERFGGLQPDDKPDSLGMIVVTEELSRGSLGAAGSLITRPEIAARALLAGGTPAQQEKWLPPLAAGKELCAISITEPNTGSDVAAVSLKASRTEGGWLLNGAKTWCTFAGRSEVLVVLARTNPDTSLGYKGLSLFLVKKPVYNGHSFTHKQEPEGALNASPLTGGTLTGKAIATLGYRGMHSYDLFFEDYFVPAENLIGEEQGEGKGLYYTMAGFAGGRIQTAARATGVMQAAYEQALRYAGERKVFGAPIADLQITRIKLARMLATITASRQFSYAVAKMMDEGKGQMEASLVKLFACRAAEWVTREAMQIHGGMGYAEETAVSRYFVDARVLSIFEGTEEVLATRVVARELLEKGALEI